MVPFEFTSTGRAQRHVLLIVLARSGIAPFRGFWMRRWEQCQQGDTVGATLLYFGCRKKTMNLLKHETDMASKSNQGYI